MGVGGITVSMTLDRGEYVCVCVRWSRAHRFDGVGALGQTSDVDFDLHLAVNWHEETLGAVDAHHSFLADLHADTALQFIHRNLHGTRSALFL